MGNAAGGSGLTEERLIIANTAGTTPTITLNAALSFTPASGSGYEILSGRLFMLSAGTLAAGMWRVYDVATNSYLANLATANLPATIGTDSAFVSLSELHVPHNRRPGEGFLVGTGTYNGGALNCLVATASAATSITGQSTGGDAGVLANEYRNFQIRIVEDTAVPTAVGQRRNISSHTAGASPVYTVPTWTVTPSATAKFVIENNGDRILLWTSAVATTFTYVIAANAWDAGTTFANKTTAIGAGVSAEQSFAIVPDIGKNARHSHIYVIRGAASNAIDLFDIAGAATGSWSENIVYGNRNQVFTTGTETAYDAATMGGRYFYINVNGTQRFARFDMLNRMLEQWCFLRFTQSTAVVGDKMATTTYFDGTTKVSLVYAMGNTLNLFFQCLIQR